MSFLHLGLSDEVLRAVEEAGYKEPTPIQRQAIPVVLQGRDVLGTAQTGTGKTASFTLPMIDILSVGRGRARMPRSLIIEPTRELAAQVAENFEIYGKYHKLTMALLIGGVSFTEQERLLDRGVDVLIATPGRLLDHIGRGRVMLNGVDVLVIDEADRMLDMGFIPDIERIMSLITQKHQTLFFSATMPPVIKRLTDRFLNNPKVIEVGRPATAAITVTQALVMIHGKDKEKRAKLRDLIRSETLKNAIIFCNRKRDVQVLYRSLERHGFNVGQLHGDMDQSSRMDVLQKFKNGDLQLLIASDVAARGLDIPDVSHVFNFDVPTHADDYVHRIGRTGRAGREGKAFTIATPEDGKLVTAIEKLMGQPIPRHDGAADTTPSEQGASQEPAASDRTPRGRGRRPAAPAADVAAAPATETKTVEAKVQEAQPKTSEPKPQPSRTKAAEARTEPKTPARPAPVKTESKPAPRPAKKAPEKRAEQAHAPVTFSNAADRSDRAKAADQAKPASPVKKSDEPRSRHGRHERDDRDEPVIGLGDHVPAFLMRPQHRSGKSAKE